MATNFGTINVLSAPSIGGVLENRPGAKIVIAGAALQAGSTYHNDGSIRVFGGWDLLLRGARGGTVAPDGSGVLTMDNSYDTARIVGSSPGLTLVNGAGHTIQGAGVIGQGEDLTFINNGTLAANQATALVIGANAFTNNGTINVASGSALTLTGSGQFTNSRTVIIDAGGGFYVNGSSPVPHVQTAGSTRVDGTLSDPSLELDGGSLSGAGTIIGNLDNAGTVSLSSSRRRPKSG